MNLVRGSTGEFCALKKGKVQPRIATGNDPECEEKKGNQNSDSNELADDF